MNNTENVTAKPPETEQTEQVEPTANLPWPTQNLLQSAFDENATDIHIDMLQGVAVIRFRIAGLIYEKSTIPIDEAQRLMNEIKVAANLDIDRAFNPQESRIEFINDLRRIDVRVTLMPTADKEAMHLRLISEPYDRWHVDNLGLYDQDRQNIESALQSPSGLVLIAGQTGTGKTTTLYTLASTLDLRNLVAVSIEDPIEFNLPYLRQVQVDENHGLTMAKGLYSIVRTDPDIIIVGEIRDQQSAITACRAALGGRLVIATIHARDGYRALEALHYMSVPSYVLGNVLHLITSQKLARRVCKECAQKDSPNAEEKKVFKNAGLTPPKEIVRPTGCEKCYSRGYKGQIGIFETLKIDPETASNMAKGFDENQLQEEFLNQKQSPLLADGLKKVADQITTIEEIARIFWLKQTQ